MEFLVYLSEPLVCYMGVDLRRTYITVSQHHLHRSKVSSVLEQMSSEAMSEEVRCDVTYSRLLTVGNHNSPECLPGKRLTVVSNKKWSRDFVLSR